MYHLIDDYQDPEYDRALHHYFWTYHNLVDLMVRVAVNEDAIIKMLIDLSAMVGLDGVPLHFQLLSFGWTFTATGQKFWLLYMNPNSFVSLGILNRARLMQA